MPQGILVTFEGPEGSGKSSLLRYAARYLRRRGYPVLVLREPGSTAISEKIRRVLLDKRNKQMTLATELFLYLAARAQLVLQKILPALRKGQFVICDRFHDSTLVYQGLAGGIPLKRIQSMSALATSGLRPLVTFLLDAEVSRGLRRAGRKDRMELKSLEFHRKVRRGFLELARREPRRFVVIRDQKTVRAKQKLVRSQLERILRVQ